MGRRTAVAAAAVLVGLALLTAPLVLHSHASHSGHVSFLVQTEAPPDGNGDTTTLNASAIPDSTQREIREVARTDDGGGSVVVHTETVEETLYPAFQSSDGVVYVRDDSAWYRLSRVRDAGGFADVELFAQGLAVCCGLALVTFGLIYRN